MKLSYNWIKEYILTTLSPDEMAARLVSLGLEVEHVEKIGGSAHSFEGIVVGHVLSTAQHPNADRLRVCMVDVGAGAPLQIVCGAANVAAGQKVPVATIGATVNPAAGEAFNIKKGKIRGEESNGMICAEDELGLGTDHSGIMVLDAALAPGTPFADTLASDSDYVLEIGLTPNRVDGASHYGTARDLAASLRVPAALPITNPVHGNTPSPVTVTVADKNRCQRYTSLYIKGIKVAESPGWLKERLTAIGLRPRNNVVDITNFVLHECGQPLHAFDAAHIVGNSIVVKTLAADTGFTTLDGVARALKADTDLMICDAEKPLCIAGVMGGLNSGVTETTTDIFLESAYFDPTTVRKTAKRLGISSDSSFRFERGADPNMTQYAALRAASLIVELAGGEISPLADLKTKTFAPFEVKISLKKTRTLIGKEIPTPEILDILHGLEITTQQVDGDVILCAVPQYRVDVQRPQDVAEEILRVYGYNNVDIPTKLHQSLNFAQYRDTFSLKQRYCDALSATGYYEILNNSLVPARVGNEKAVHLLNPLSEELGIMRQSLIHGVLETLQYNQNRQMADAKVYESGKTYQKGSKPGAFFEQDWLVLAVAGQQHAPHWTGKGNKSSLYTLTKEVERLQAFFAFSGDVGEVSHDEFDYGLQLTANKRQVARWGKVTQRLANQYDLRNDVFYLAIDWAVLSEVYYAAKFKFREIPQFPGTRRDVSMLLDKQIAFTQIAKAANGANPQLIRSVDLHDVYTGDKLAEGKKGYLISLEIRDDAKTLSDDVVDKVMERVFKSLESQLGAEIRKA